MDYARRLFSLEPDITSPRLLQKLHEKYPDKITGKELRTLRRRLANWRRESLTMTVRTLDSNTKYDALAFSESLQNLTQKALKLGTSSGKIFVESTFDVRTIFLDDAIRAYLI